MKNIKDFAEMLGFFVFFYLLIGLLVLPAVVFGEVTGEFSAGYSHSMGNEDSMSSNVGLSLSDKHYNARARMRYAETDGEPDAERYDGYLRGRYPLTFGSAIMPDYWFSGVEYALDEYGATKEETLLYIGVGKYIVNEWSIELGPGFRVVDIDGHSTFRVASKVDHTFKGTQRFIAEATWIKGGGTSVLVGEAELRVGIAKAGIEVRNVSPASEGAEGTDIRTTVGLVVGF